MEKDKHVTEVKFLYNEKTEDLYAFFHKEHYYSKRHPEYKRVFNAYAHIGQHSSCHIEYANESRAAKPSEYRELKKELESIGYNLKVVK